jgi:DNA polymerase III epsilon subunit-like protein
MYLFFDTETTGKITDYKASFKEVEKFPRITQFAWQLYNSEGKLFKSFQSLVKPNGWKIPTVEEQIAKGEKNPNFFVENNMSTERCEKEGRPIKPMLEQFLNELEGCKYLLAHNMNFDLPVTASEMYRLGFQAKNKPQKICTMQSTTDICRLPGPYGFKWPSLQELHKFLFGCDFEGAHDASDDVTATAKCFFELKRRNLLVITE